MDLIAIRPLVVGLTIWLLHYVWAFTIQSGARRRVRARVLKVRRLCGICVLNRIGPLNTGFPVRKFLLSVLFARIQRSSKISPLTTQRS